MSARDRLTDPHLTPAELAHLAHEHPDLHQAIATHPLAYDALLHWIATYSPDSYARELASGRISAAPPPATAAQGPPSPAGSGMPGPGRPPGHETNSLMKFVAAVVILAVIGSAVVIARVFLGGGPEPDPTASAEPTPVSTSTSADPTDNPEPTSEPTDEPTNEPTNKPTTGPTPPVERASAQRIDNNLERISEIDEMGDYINKFDEYSPYVVHEGNVKELVDGQLIDVDLPGVEIYGAYGINDGLVFDEGERDGEAAVIDIRTGSVLPIPATRGDRIFSSARINTDDRILGIYRGTEGGPSPDLSEIEIVMFDRAGTELWNLEIADIEENYCVPDEDFWVNQRPGDHWLELYGACAGYVSVADGTLLSMDAEIISQEPDYVVISSDTEVSIMDPSLETTIIAFDLPGRPVEQTDADLDDLISALETLSANPPEDSVAIVDGGIIVDYWIDSESRTTVWNGQAFYCPTGTGFIDHGNQLICRGDTGTPTAIYNLDGSTAFEAPAGTFGGGYLIRSNQDQWIFHNGLDFAYALKDTP